MKKMVPSLKGVSVLVVDADCRHGLSVVRSLGKEGCIVDVIVSNDRSPASVSRYVRQAFIHPCKRLPKEELVFHIGDILASYKYDVAIAAGTEGFQALSWGRESLSRFTKIPMPDYETFALAEDKARTMQFASRIGLDIPATYYTFGIESVEAIPQDFRFPLVVKAAGGQGHVFYAQDSGQLKQSYRLLCEEVPEQIADGRWPIIQEFIPGRSHGFFALLHEGQVLIHFMHERVRTVPPDGGASAIAKTHFNQKLMDSGTRLLETLMWHGVAMAEFRLDERDGRYCLIEANPRFWGSLALAIRAGVDFPSLLVRMALGINLEQLEQYEYWRNPTIFQWLSMDIAYSFAVKKPWMWLGPVFRGIPNDFQLSDPKPNLSMILGGAWETLKGSRKLNRSTKTE